MAARRLDARTRRRRVAGTSPGSCSSGCKKQGGLAAMAERNRAKAKKLYAAIDGSGFYKNPVEKSARSWMNVPFTLAEPGARQDVSEESKAAGLTNLEGHRVGRRHAREHLQRDAAGGRGCAGRFHGGFREAQRMNATMACSRSRRSTTSRVAGLDRLPRDRYEVASEIGEPDAILRALGRHARDADRRRA